MKKTISILLAAWAFSVPAGAQVYKCTVDGKTVFTSQFMESCEKQDLKVTPADPVEAKRIRAALARDEAEERAKQEAQAHEREIRAQEDQAREIRRQADFAREQARLQEEQVRQLRQINNSEEIPETSSRY